MFSAGKRSRRKVSVIHRHLPHSQMTEEELLAAGITPTTVRLSIGIEHIDDILQT
ncbi:MAG: PLP-dependent transferase [Ruminococcus sp.]